ncbi:MAG: histidinol dehydrogenase [Candidatus Gracilibacteria bacterium]|nr:histidinol dehydrogenase [Candidatus Gracilibacteria bacterium]
MQTLDISKTNPTQILQIIRNQRSKSEDVENIVKPILADIRQNGDAAVLKYARKFDSPDLKTFVVSEKEISAAYNSINPKLLASLKIAKKNIEKFHKASLIRKEKVVETSRGVKVWREFRAIEKVGLYIPGGKAAYPSTVLMLAIPAQIAGCQEIVICTPADKAGNCNPTVLAAAKLCGVKKIFKVGGSQAIAAMAFGTETIPKVYKIFGPGNQFVTTAKMLVYGEVDIDMPAGPSEVGIIADNSANPAFIAADFLSQLEHGEDSQSVLFTNSAALIEKVKAEIVKQIETLSRKAIIQISLQKSFAILCKNDAEIASLANEYAAEHLEIVAKNEAFFLKAIQNAGSIFLGEYTSEPLGDYATGANHTLPTSGFAKMFSPLSADSFGKMIQIQKVSKAGLQKLSQTVETIATSEGLDAHKNAISIRLK